MIYHIIAMLSYHLPCMPIFSTSELRSVILSEKQSNLAAIFRNFSESDMKRCISMVDVM